jgi:hypothetical protein
MRIQLWRFHASHSFFRLLGIGSSILWFISHPFALVAVQSTSQSCSFFFFFFFLGGGGVGGGVCGRINQSLGLQLFKQVDFFVFCFLFL